MEMKQKQQRLDEIQAMYRNWLEAQKKLMDAQKDWQHAIQLMKQLEQFYFQGEYREYLDAEEQGTVWDCRTEGEFSVLSEDALWNAFHEYQQFAWQQLRTAISILDQSHET